jgi:hypothetical protein
MVRRIGKAAGATLAAVALTAASAVAAYGWSSGTLQAKSGRTVLAQGSFTGVDTVWDSAGVGGWVHKATGSITDKAPKDAYKVYLEHNARREIWYWIPVYGGASYKGYGLNANGSRQSTRTSSSLTRVGMGFTGKVKKTEANMTTRFYQEVKICADKPLAPDPCGKTAKYVGKRR